MEADVAPAALSETALAAADGQRPMWWYAIAAWLGQRLFLVAFIALWLAMSNQLTPASFSAQWAQYDSNFYVSIAHDGYHTISQAAFFPFFPVLIALVAPLVGGNYLLAGVLLANVAGLGAFVALGRLVEVEFGPRPARRALLYYAILPTGFFLTAVYTESIFLLLSVAAFLCMRQRRWLLAGLLITLATITRAPGVLLTVPLAIEAWCTMRPEWTTAWTRRRIREALALACAFVAPFGAILGFQLYLMRVYGAFDVMARAQALPHWRRSLDWPWVGLGYELDPVVQALRGAHPQIYAANLFIDLLSLAFWLGSCVLMVTPFWQVRAPWLPLPWVMYSWVALIQALVTPAHISGEGLLSLIRFIVVIFPCFVLLALVSLRFRSAHLALFGLFIGLTILMLYIMVRGGFIA
jgi:hypothetical protein